VPVPAPSRPRCRLVLAACLAITGHWLPAGEHLLGYVKGAEPLPRGAQEAYVFVTSRQDKGAGRYQAVDYLAEYEVGITNRFTAGGALKALSLNTENLWIDGYLPGPRRFGLKASGVELETLYNFLSPARDDLGLSASLAFDYSWVDPHSGQAKDTASLELALLGQKYFREGQVIWLANLGLESTYAHRAPIAGLPEGFDWPTDPEMELELKFGTGLACRIAPRWFVGGEALYETEFETAIGQERWTWFAGPTLHLSLPRGWITLTYLQQLVGGGERFDAQENPHLHLIEKTKSELRLKVALNF
jgi:hypothetical protein